VIFNFTYNESELESDSEIEPEVESETITKPIEEDTIVLYAYPSSWQDNLPYRLYKCTWSKKILDICSINPKGTYEG